MTHRLGAGSPSWDIDGMGGSGLFGFTAIDEDGDVGPPFKVLASIVAIESSSPFLRFDLD